jgi:hypothetical protein
MNDDGEMTAKKLQGKILPPRHALARSMILGLNDVRLAMIVAERMADRLEGKPVQKLHHELPHTTIFYRAEEPKPPEVVAVEAAAASAGNGSSVSSHHGRGVRTLPARRARLGFRLSMGPGTRRVVVKASPHDLPTLDLYWQDGPVREHGRNGCQVDEVLDPGGPCRVEDMHRLRGLVPGHDTY